jgi:triple sensor domain protein
MAAVDDTIRRSRSVTAAVAQGNTVIRTETVISNDGRVHGVHLWSGPAAARPPRRSLPGAVSWDLTTGRASDTPQALFNAGLDLSVEKTDGRTFAADMPVGHINRDEAQVLALSMSCKPGDTFCSTWDATSHAGERIRVSFVARSALERHADGTEHLVARAMNWRLPYTEGPEPDGDLARQIVRDLAQAGIHRALVDLRTWNLLKWLDPPFPHADWRGEVTGQPFVHPDEGAVLRAMALQFATGPTEGLLRLRATGGGWTVVHATVYRVHLLDDNVAGLISIRLPTPAELLRKSHTL